MHSIKATWAGHTLAFAKPNESGGKKSRNRIPREERKSLVESFIKKHQRLNNGSFPSISLTHREVGGSFYTVREIFREIIQENRVLGPAEWIFEEKGNDQNKKESQSISILMEPVAPLSLPPNGSSSALGHRHYVQETLVVVPNTCSSEAETVKALGNVENINGSQEGLKDREPHLLVSEDSEAIQLLEEHARLLAQHSSGSASIISESLPASYSENNVSEYDVVIRESLDILNSSFSLKHGVRKLENGENVHGIHYDMEHKENVEITCSESEATEHIEVGKTVKDAATAMTETMSITGSASGTVTTIIDRSASVVVETFPLTDSCDGQSSELDYSSDTGKRIGTEGAILEVGSSCVNTVRQEMASATTSMPGEKTVEVIVDQLGSKSSDPLEEIVGENIINPASINIECVNAKDTVVVDAPFSDVNQTRESSKGTLSAWTTEQNSKESGKAENDATKTDGMYNLVADKAAVVKETDMQEGKVDATDGSSSQKGSIAEINRIKPESWKGGSNNVAAQETNPLVSILKAFVAALVKFWSE